MHIDEMIIFLLLKTISVALGTVSSTTPTGTKTASKRKRKAHQASDRAVMQTYGFDVKTMTESACVAELMKMYQKMTK